MVLTRSQERGIIKMRTGSTYFEKGGEASGTGEGLSGTSALYRTKRSDHRDRESDAQGRPVCKGRTAAGNLPVRIRDQAG